MNFSIVHELYNEQENELYGVERRLMLTMPKMEKARFSPRLDIGFSEYSEEFNGCLARGSMTAYRNGGSRS
jgi:hypothetical protein